MHPPAEPLLQPTIPGGEGPRFQIGNPAGQVANFHLQQAEMNLDRFRDGHPEEEVPEDHPGSNPQGGVALIEHYVTRIVTTTPSFAKSASTQKSRSWIPPGDMVRAAEKVGMKLVVGTARKA